MASCKKCGIDISADQLIIFFGHCKDCFHLKPRLSKRQSIGRIIMGLIFSSFGILGIYIIVKIFISNLPPTYLIGFVIEIIFLVLLIFLMVVLTSAGFLLIKWGIRI